jgi:hypothetical protein
MQGKIAFEEHFGIEETLEQTRVFAGESSDFSAFTRQLLDLGDERLGHMDETGIGLAILSLNAPGVQRILDPAEAHALAQKANGRWSAFPPRSRARPRSRRDRSAMPSRARWRG